MHTVHEETPEFKKQPVGCRSSHSLNPFSGPSQILSAQSHFQHYRCVCTPKNTGSIYDCTVNDVITSYMHTITVSSHEHYSGMMKRADCGRHCYFNDHQPTCTGRGSWRKCMRCACSSYSCFERNIRSLYVTCTRHIGKMYCRARYCLFLSASRNRFSAFVNVLDVEGPFCWYSFPSHVIRARFSHPSPVTVCNTRFIVR